MPHLNYLAGLFDHRGTVCFEARYKRPSLRFRISLYSTDSWLIEGLWNILGGFRWYDEKNRGWRWTVEGHQATKVARQLLPYMKNPRRIKDFEKILLWSQEMSR